MHRSLLSQPFEEGGAAQLIVATLRDILPQCHEIGVLFVSHLYSMAELLTGLSSEIAI